MSAPFQLSLFRAELGAMKRFETKQIKEAIAYAQAGGQALHVWEPHTWRHRKNVPAVFRRSDLWAHLFDNDRDRLLRTVKWLGVRVIKIDREGERGQHIDLCAGPLQRALALCSRKG